MFTQQYWVWNDFENMGDGSKNYENIIPWWNKLPVELAYNSDNWLFVQLLPFCLEAPGIRKLWLNFLSVTVFLYLQKLLCQPVAASSDVLLMNRWPVAGGGENILLVRKAFVSSEMGILGLFDCSIHKPKKSQMLSWIFSAEKGTRAMSPLSQIR